MSSLPDLVVMSYFHQTEHDSAEFAIHMVRLRVLFLFLQLAFVLMKHMQFDLSGQRTGLASIGEKLRRTNAHRLFVGRLEDLEVGKFKRYACAEKHPGLCFSRDADKYQECLHLAKQIEKWSSCRSEVFHVARLDHGF